MENGCCCYNDDDHQNDVKQKEDNIISDVGDHIDKDDQVDGKQTYRDNEQDDDCLYHATVHRGDLKDHDSD